MITKIDKYIGKKIRQRRIELKMRLKQLGNAVGVSHQQFAKYEKGINRVSASRLFEIARVLDVNITYFFKGGSR